MLSRSRLSTLSSERSDCHLSKSIPLVRVVGATWLSDLFHWYPFHHSIPLSLVEEYIRSAAKGYIPTGPGVRAGRFAPKGISGMNSGGSYGQTSPLFFYFLPQSQPLHLGYCGMYLSHLSLFHSRLCNTTAPASMVVAKKKNCFIPDRSCGSALGADEKV